MFGRTPGYNGTGLPDYDREPPYRNGEGDSDQDYNEGQNEGDNDEEAFDGNDGDQEENGEDDMDRFKRQASGCRALTNSCRIDKRTACPRENT